MRSDHSTLEGNLAFAAEVKESVDQVDLLVNNAGGLIPRREITADGVEMTLALNLRAPVVLTDHLHPVFARDGLVVNVTSDAFSWFDGDPFDGLDDADDYHPFRAYARAKLLLVLATLAQARQLEPEGVRVVAVNPGPAWTPGTQVSSPDCLPGPKVMWPIVRLVQRSRWADQAARVLTRVAVAPDEEIGAGVTGGYVTARGKVRALGDLDGDLERRSVPSLPHGRSVTSTSPCVEAAMAEGIHADQRRVAFHRQPTEGRRVVVFFHPAPGSGVFRLPTSSEDIAVVGVDRPGYGSSDPMPDGRWATVASAADDAAAVLDALGVTRATAIGWSAGGRVALALAARHPEAVAAIVVLATPAPHEEVHWVPASQYESLVAMRGDPADAVHARLAGQLQVMTPADPRSDEALVLLPRSPADDHALDDDDLRAGLGDMLEVAFRQGVVGLAQDIAGFMLQPWGFEWGAVGAPTLLVYGQNDPLARPRHGEWWQSAMPNAELTTVTGAGHISVVREWQAAVQAVQGRS